MIKKLILSTLLLCGLANAAPTSTLDAVLERGVLRVGFDAGYQPFEMTNKQGQYLSLDQILIPVRLAISVLGNPLATSARTSLPFAMAVGFRPL